MFPLPPLPLRRMRAGNDSIRPATTSRVLDRLGTLTLILLVVLVVVVVGVVEAGTPKEGDGTGGRNTFSALQNQMLGCVIGTLLSVYFKCQSIFITSWLDFVH